MEGNSNAVRNPEVAQAIAAGMPECPVCHGRNVRASYTLNLLDRLAAIASYAPFRCRVCQHRFYKRPPKHHHGLPAPADSAGETGSGSAN